MSGRSVTWVFCQCGHFATLDRQEGPREDILRRFRCKMCGEHPNDLRHGYVAAETMQKNTE
jgi:hypothetical protein